MENTKLSAVGALVLELGQHLVDKPSQVNVLEINGSGSTLLELKVCKPDAGKILGKGGATADNIRRLMTCISGRLKHTYRLEILEPSLPPSQGFPAEPEQRDPVRDVAPLLKRMVMAIVDLRDEVTVNPLVGSRIVVFEVNVAPDDYRRALGRGGQNVAAVRALIECIGAKHEKKYKVELIDPEGREQRVSARGSLFGG